jgi:hypothetical protein
MQLNRKHITFIQLFSFLLMIGLMVFLNNKQETAKNNSGRKHTSEFSININNLGIAPLASAIPEKTEAALPLKLISNPNSNFLFLFNQSRELKSDFRFIQLKKLYFVYCSKFQNNFLIEFLATMRNKDIR